MKLITKSLTVTALSIAGLAAINTQAPHVQAATVDVTNVTITAPSVAVWDGIENAHFTGHELKANTTWKVLKTAYDGRGNKWFDLGNNQWILAKYTNQDSDKSNQTYVEPTTSNYSQQVTPVQKQQTVHVQQSYVAPVQKQQTVQTQQSYVAPVQKQQAVQPQQSYVAPAQKQQVVQSQVTDAPSATSSVEESAKAWIANHESGGSYSARNGQFIGKYQLSASYLGGDYSAENQERVANNYVKGRYGSWAGAQQFWQMHGWY